MNIDNEQSLRKRPEQALFRAKVSPESKETDSGPLGDMVTKVLRELKALPDIRTGNDLPEDLVYLLNRQDGLLLRISRRRPRSVITNSQLSGRLLRKEFVYGYFAEIMELDEQGTLQHTLSKNPTGQGLYERVDVTDMLQKEMDPRSAGLTPTNFDFTRELFLKRPEFQRQLPSAEQSETGILEQLFVAANRSAERIHGMEKEMREDIIRNFDNDSFQGMSDEIGNLHLIIADEGEDSPLFKISQELGISTYAIPFWRAALDIRRFIGHFMKANPGVSVSDVFPFKNMHEARYFPQDPLNEFKKRFGVEPMIVSFDARVLAQTLNKQDFQDARHEINYTVDEASGNHPLFSFIEISETIHNEHGSPKVRRFIKNGRYVFHDPDLSSMKGLLIKFGTDFALTKQIRAIAQMV